MKPRDPSALRAARRGMLLAACGWTVALFMFGAFEYGDARHDATNMARLDAVRSLEKDVAHRQWVSLHGGMYVPVTKKTPPNPFLADWPERDITTPSGKQLTLMNPAYMTRQIYEWFKASYGVMGHISSLKPLNPVNTPDAWETAALKAVEGGAKEISSIETTNGEPVLRFMRPLITEKPCLKCHAAQGYKEGDVRGGISAEVPLKPYRAASASHMNTVWLCGGGVWLLGLLGLLVGHRRASHMIQQREQGRKHLREIQDRLRLLYDSMLEGMAVHEMICDAGGHPCDYRFLQVNPAFERLTGLKAANIIGKTVRELLPNFERKWIERYGLVALTGEPCEFEDYSADLGRYFHVAAFCPQKGHFAVTFSDITERKKTEKAERETRAAALNMMEDAVTARNRAEQAGKALQQEMEDRRTAEGEVRRLNVELEQRVRDRTAQIEATNKELEAFSYSVSHDLRAPLRALNGFASILTEDYTQRLDEEGRRLLGTISSEASRMGQMIDELLAFSRLGRQSMQVAEINMTAVAQLVFDECAAQAPGRKIQFKLHPLPVAWGDVTMIPHVWANLISNAIKYSRNRPVAEIEITSRADANGEVVYCVKDNGVGFEMQYADKLFRVFQRLHSETEFEGTGIGLALVLRIIQRHGGRVWAEGKLNEGSLFFFTLPNAAPKQTASI